MRFSAEFSRSSPAYLAITAAVGFLALGAATSSLGPSLPALQERHGLGATGVSLLVAVFSAGSAVGVVVAGVLRRRVTGRAGLVGGAGALAVGCGLVPVAADGVLAAGALFVAGIGFGAVDLVANLVVANGFGRRGGAVLSLVSAAFGVSAVVLPLVIGRAPGNLALPYLVAAAVAVVFAVLAAGLRMPLVLPAPSGVASRAELRVVVLLAAIVLGYVALEGGIAGWETTHLRGTTELSAGAAVDAVALFWFGLTAGRVLGAPLALRWHPGRLVVVSLALGAAAVAVAALTPYAVAAYAVAGLVIAPVFPAVVGWHAMAVPSGRGATAVFAAGLAGPIVGSPLIGVATDATGAAAVPWVLAGFALVTAAAAGFARRRAPEATTVDPVRL
ncbi:MFS transporter [Umezawaea tangerina]|uniref:Fucose permease n=1 Tax=Umezawaea tangerina TaxID=84725 RepID=A0A2T0SQA0_9PSEU|nr:MFS transporter [Umezawaea tangerina]PRY35585.1 fucose permease [Umezawaea tangerina]